MARGDQLSRQWKIVQALSASRMGKSVSDLALDLDGHPRSVYRDLEALQAAGFPLYTEKQGRRSLWRLLGASDRQIPIPFSLPELMALYFSRDMLKVLEHTVFHDALETLFQKIKTTLPPAYAAYLDRIAASLAVAPRPHRRYVNLKETVDRISEAIAARRILAMTYFTMSRHQSRRRHVAPYKIWFFDDAFYLIGACRFRKDIRIFALDRISDLHVTDKTFQVPEGLDIDERLTASFGVFMGEPETVRVWFSADVAGYIREKTWHGTQKITDRADGSIEFEARVAGTHEIKFWILKWGAKARVLAPEALREAIRVEVEAMGNHYRRSG